MKTKVDISKVFKSALFQLAIHFFGLVLIFYFIKNKDIVIFMSAVKLFSIIFFSIYFFITLKKIKREDISEKDIIDFTFYLIFYISVFIVNFIFVPMNLFFAIIPFLGVIYCSRYIFTLLKKSGKI